MLSLSLSLSLFLLFAVISAAPAAAVEQQKEAFTGGAFDFRKQGLATSRPVPPSEVDPMPLLGDLKWDRRSLTNQLVVRLDPRSAALNEALLRTTDARLLDTTPSRERAFVNAIRSGKDTTLNRTLGGVISARAVIATQRDSDDLRLAADERSPRELLQQMIVLRYDSVDAAEKRLLR